MAIIEDSRELDRKIADVVAITQEIFDCAPDLEIMHDPEYPDCNFLVLTVEFRGGPADLLQKRLDWHSRKRSVLSGDVGNLRLSVIFSATA